MVDHPHLPILRKLGEAEQYEFWLQLLVLARSALDLQASPMEFGEQVEGHLSEWVRMADGRDEKAMAMHRPEGRGVWCEQCQRMASDKEFHL